MLNLKRGAPAAAVVFVLALVLAAAVYAQSRPSIVKQQGGWVSGESSRVMEQEIAVANAGTVAVPANTVLLAVFVESTGGASGFDGLEAATGWRWDGQTLLYLPARGTYRAFLVSTE